MGFLPAVLSFAVSSLTKVCHNACPVMLARTVLCGSVDADLSARINRNVKVHFEKAVEILKCG